MYNHAPADYQCPFCQLIHGRENGRTYSLHTDIICQTDAITAFIGSHQWPRNPGNAIIVPNRHFENIFDLPAALAADIHEAAQAIALAMKRAYQCDGVSTRQHNEPAGNQDVWHYHLHVTPRYADDRFYATLTTERFLMPPEERARHANRIKKQLLG